MFVDNGRINEATKFDCLSLPRLDKTFDVCSGSTVLYRLDLAIAYHQIRDAPSAVNKTALITYVKRFKILKMLFKLGNALLTYLVLISIVLRGFIFQICCAYFDDEIVFCCRVVQHLEDLFVVFTRIFGAGFKFKAPKCQLLSDNVSNLSHIINASGVCIDLAKLRVC